MKIHQSTALSGHEYVMPGISVIHMETEQILCASDWNNGSVTDSDDNWNIMDTI